MKEYRLAFFTADWNYELVETTLHGLKRYVDEHENVSICIFDCFGKDIDTAKERSEYAIFDLADLSEFDGLIVQGNQIVLRSIRDRIAKRVVASGIPAISIDCPLDGCALLSVDNEGAQYDMVEHLIKEHNARRLVYLTGILENGCPEGHQRLNGFLRACRDNGIPESDIEVIACTWRTRDGQEVAERWLDDGNPLPDAFVCANDDMALGLMEVLEDHHLVIPRDVIVTGFDNLSSAELSSPRLSTINREYEKLTYVSVQVLIDRIEGRDTRDVINFAHQLVASESCGCKGMDAPLAIRDKYFRQTRFLKDFYILQDRMAEQMLEADSLMELMNIVESNQSMFGCDNIYLCINDYYYDNYDKKQWYHNSESFGDEMILAACRETGVSGKINHRYSRFRTRRLLPGDILRRERFMMFYPLHYNTYSIGYLAMNGISEAAKLNLHKSIFNFVEIAIENIRKKCLLRQLNDVLDNLYVRDGMTQFYNRYGFQRFARQVFDSFLVVDGAAQILFVDMDDMKGINDRYGHEAGDAAILLTAEILRRTCSERDFLMRYGGDEFLVITSGKSETLEADIQRAVAASREKGDKPFKLSLSIGIVRVERGDPRSLDECILSADQLMYDKKKKRRPTHW